MVGKYAKPNDVSMVGLVLKAVLPKTGSAVQVFRSLLCFGIATLAVFVPPNSSAQTSKSVKSDNVDALVRDVIHNEVESQLHDNSLWCYREQKQEDGKPSKTLEVCQTKDGELERVVAVNGRELDAAQKQAEDERIQDLIAHPEQLRAKQKKEREDGEQARNLLKTIPDAFRFQCESESANLITLRFWPNPGFRPYTRASTVFHHMEGTLVLDTQQKRIVEVNGRLTSEVRFMGGLLGHLDRNGTFEVKQMEVGDGHWDLTSMSVHMNGKALLFKTIAVSEKEALLDYKPLPHGASLQQAADFLMRDFDLHTASAGEKSK